LKRIRLSSNWGKKGSLLLPKKRKYLQGKEGKKTKLKEEKGVRGFLIRGGAPQGEGDAESGFRGGKIPPTCKGGNDIRWKGS